MKPGATTRPRASMDSCPLSAPPRWRRCGRRPPPRRGRRRGRSRDPSRGRRGSPGRALRRRDRRPGARRRPSTAAATRTRALTVGFMARFCHRPGGDGRIALPPGGPDARVGNRGRARVVRAGSRPPRTLPTGAGSRSKPRRWPATSTCSTAWVASPAATSASRSGRTGPCWWTTSSSRWSRRSRPR
mgnify:CR=1 FL=1